MKDYYKMIKRWDIIVVISLVILSFLPFFIFQYTETNKHTDETKYVAVISVNNKVFRTITLTGNEGTEIFDVHSENGGVNTIEVVNDRIRIKGANCSDQVCVSFGFISKPGETIVCLPHKVVIEVQSSDGNDDGLIISS